jgi:predicted NAD-dependent protein-ADP-ribosyltransferase YbiA (DUF1768 family)
MHGAELRVCPTCGAEGGTYEAIFHEQQFVEDALRGEGADGTGRQNLGFSVSAHEEQSWRSTPAGADVSSVRRKRISRSEIEERTCRSAINLIARELEQAFGYRAPTLKEDQDGADGFARLEQPASKEGRGPQELPLQVIHSNKDAVAEVGRHDKFESHTTIKDLLVATLKMIDLKFVEKRHNLFGTVLLLRADTELPRAVLAGLLVELTQTPRECLGVIYIPNADPAVALQPLDCTRARALLGLNSQA